jgi:peptide/bleomycin uptake transporter
MFVSFFPNPRPFFWSAAIWTLIVALLWMFGASEWGQYIGLPNPPSDAKTIIGPRALSTPDHLYFGMYFLVCSALFYFAWNILAPHKWSRWSVLGSLFIIYITYFQVQLGVAINSWYGEFYNLVQKALADSTKGTVPASELYSSFSSVVGILVMWVITVVGLNFFTSHFVFRWRTAMSDYYVGHWEKLRKIEGASQRVQEDTMRFARLLEDLGTSFINSVMTLIAFLPVLSRYSEQIKTVPLIGELPNSLVLISIIWAIFGTVFLAIIGGKLPGLEFKNQRVEAALRKELVYGEDFENRAAPPTVFQLFDNVRKNYYRLYWNYLYFNFGRFSFIQADAFLALFVMVPTIASGAFSFGLFRQISNAMGEVKESLQYLVRSWPSIIDLLSIYKRLRTFEAAIHGEAIDLKREYALPGQIEPEQA